MTTTALTWPKKTTELVNYILDSRRWNDFEYRDGDIVIDTWAKTGTTLMQQIVGQLVFGGDEAVFGPALSPWPDFQPMPDAVQVARAQTHRRFLKSHLPVEALPISPKAKYIYISRDARDVIWSWHNHVVNARTDTRDTLMPAHMRDMPMPPPPIQDIRVFYHDFLDGGPSQPYPFWTHVQGWWNIRALPNVLLLHFANLIADLPREIQRIAAFLEIALDEKTLAAVTDHCRIDYMRERAAREPSLPFDLVWQEGAKTFFNKGTNGRWRDVLTQAEIAKCDEIAARELTADCANWLRTGAL